MAVIAEVFLQKSEDRVCMPVWDTADPKSLGEIAYTWSDSMNLEIVRGLRGKGPSQGFLLGADKKDTKLTSAPS